MTLSAGYRYEDIVESLGDAGADALLGRADDLTFSTNGRDHWIALVQQAARRMVDDDRAGEDDVAVARAATAEVLRAAGDRVLREGRDEVTGDDLDRILVQFRIWPFT